MLQYTSLSDQNMCNNFDRPYRNPCKKNISKLNVIFVISATVKPVLSCHSKIDKTKVLKTGGSSMQVEGISSE